MNCNHIKGELPRVGPGLKARLISEPRGSPRAVVVLPCLKHPRLGSGVCHDLGCCCSQTCESAIAGACFESSSGTESPRSLTIG